MKKIVLAGLMTAALLAPSAALANPLPRHPSVCPPVTPPVVGALAGALLDCD